MFNAWRVYSKSGERLAAFKYPEHAARFVASLDTDGTTIRFGGNFEPRIVWTDGKDGHASESLENVAVHCRQLLVTN